MHIGVLRGRENSFPDAFIAKVNSMDKGVTAEYIQLGGTKLNEPVPYRVVLDRMSHEVPYYAVYLKMAALQGTYCINNTFVKGAFGHKWHHCCFWILDNCYTAIRFYCTESQCPITSHS